MISLTELLAMPELFPDAIFADRGLLDCYRVDRTLLAESPFLDNRMTARSGGRERVSYTDAEIQALASGARTEAIGFIFHTSFCRSTLMAQALHVDGQSFALKEPSILLSLADSIRNTRTMRDLDKVSVTLPAMLRLTTGLMTAGEKVIIKPTNFANNLLPHVARTGARILLMYSDLRSYLTSILKYHNRGRAFTRQLYVRLMADSRELRDMDPRRALLLTDLQIAALVWKQQMNLFTQVMQDTPPGQICTLASDVFGARREETLAEVFRFFAIPLVPGRLADILSGPVFQQHSKSGKSVDEHSIQQDNRMIADTHKEELEAALHWAESSTTGGRVVVPLPNALPVPPG
ncbi:MAG: hypothetical protein R3F42_14615 [Pseudomonadota bacterium]